MRKFSGRDISRDSGSLTAKLITSDLSEQSRETTVRGPNLLPVVGVVGTEVSDGGRDVDAVNVVYCSKI